jgi:hypothetical protein
VKLLEEWKVHQMSRSSETNPDASSATLVSLQKSVISQQVIAMSVPRREVSLLQTHHVEQVLIHPLDHGGGHR